MSLLAKMDAAMAAKDETAMNEIFHDDYKFTMHASGNVLGKVDVIKWAKDVESRGAGEILLQFVDTDGRQKGFDIELAKEVIDSVTIPVVVTSGAGKLEDIKDLIENTQPSGVAISSLLHYDSVTIKEVKDYLRKNNIAVSG